MIIRLIQKLGILLFLSSLLVLGSCGGGDSDGSSDAGNLDGTWAGNLEDPFGTMHTFSVTISNDNITSMRQDGVDTGLTGTITQESTNVFGFTLSDATEGGFIADAARQHVAFVDEEFSVGALQKGASALPSFAQADIAGTTSGATVTTDFVTFQEFTGTITCNSSGSCNGSDDLVGNFSAFLSYTSLGRWTGMSSFSSGTANVSVFLTADKQFAGFWSCDFSGGGTFPQDCSFSAWLR